MKKVMDIPGQFILEEMNAIVHITLRVMLVETRAILERDMYAK